jgi:hypothetical protein
MHRHRIIAQISLILSILNLVLAAPIVVQEIHEARGDEMVVAEDVAAMPKKWRELEAASDRSTSPRATQPGQEVQEVQDAMTSPQHSADGSVSSGYSAPYLSSGSSDSGYSWLLERPPRLSPNRPPPLHDSDSTSVHPNPGSADGSASSRYSAPYLSSDESVSGYSWMLDRPPRLSPNHPPPLHDLDSTSVHPNSGSLEITPEEWFGPAHPLEEIPASPPALLQELTPLPQGPQTHPSSSGSSEIPPSSQPTGSDRATTEPEGLAPSRHLTSDAPPPSPSSPPTETPPDNAEYFNKNMMKKIKIVAGVVIVGGLVMGIAGSQIKHHDSRDS